MTPLPVLGDVTRRTVRVEASGEASPALAWRRYERPELWGTWAPHIRGVDYPHPTIVPGGRGVVRGVGGVRARFVIASVDAATRRWVWRVRSGPVSMRLEHGVDPDPRGSRTWVVVTGPVGVTDAYAVVCRLVLPRLVAR